VLRFEILGPWRVSSAGEPVAVPPGRLRVLLAVLIASGRWVAADVLAARLWPDRARPNERAHVHTYVARLRRLLGSDSIETSSDGYRIATTVSGADLWEFRDLRRRSGAAGRIEDELALLRQASMLWRGTPFAGLRSQWLDREVVPRLEYERLAAVERRTDLERRLGLLAPVTAGSAAIRQLPPAAASFTSRPELERLHALVTGARGAGCPARVVALVGAPGIGKTTLALHFAHAVAHAYPDMQLYLNLRGHGPDAPLAPSAAVAALLRGLGVRSRLIPTGTATRAALLRRTLAGRRVLMLLDNVRDAGQVCPLLPGGDSLIVVTSRDSLAGLAVQDGARRLTLGPLARHDALALVASAYGRDGVVAEPAAAARLVEMCAGHPLALAIAAERAQRAGGLARVARAMADERARLDLFGGEDGDPYNELWATLAWSYRALDPDAAHMFRVLGSHASGEVTLADAAALAGLPKSRTGAVLESLAAAHLVRQRRPRRYEMHTVIRWYARERARLRLRQGGDVPPPHGAVDHDVQRAAVRSERGVGAGVAQARQGDRRAALAAVRHVPQS
jgi:hypothetical protein